MNKPTEHGLIESSGQMLNTSSGKALNTSSGQGFRRTRWAAWMLCLLPLAALAEQPGGAGSGGSVDSPDVSVSPNLDAGDGANGLRKRPSEEQWRAAAEFLTQYSPKRMALLTQMPEGRTHGLKSLIYSRYLALMKVKDTFPQLYQIGLQRLQIEDNLFDLRRKYLAASGTDKSALKDDMRQQVTALFENLQSDRQSRISRMKSYMDELQAKHDADEHNRQSVIEQQLNSVIVSGTGEIGRGNRFRHNNTPPNGKSSPGESFQPTTNPD